MITNPTPTKPCSGYILWRPSGPVRVCDCHWMAPAPDPRPAATR